MGRGLNPNSISSLAKSRKKIQLISKKSKNNLINQVRDDIDSEIYDLDKLKASSWEELNNYRDQLHQLDENNQLEIKPADRPKDSDVRIVVADIHGNYRNLYRLLLASGAINKDGSRNPGYWVCQIGDLIHGGDDVYRADNDASLLGSQWIDCQLIGNHDLAFLGGRVESKFARQHSDLFPGLQNRLNRGVRTGQWRAAIGVDGWLITHAGAQPELLEKAGLINDYSFDEKEVEQLGENIENAYLERMHSEEEVALFEWIGPNRSGSDQMGSIFWSDWRELIQEYQKHPSWANHCRQLVGHSAQKTKEPVRAVGCLNIDLAGVQEYEGSVSAAIKTKNESDWQTVVLERAQRPDPQQ